MNRLGETAIKLEQDFMEHLRTNGADTALESKLKSWMREEEDLGEAADVCEFKQAMDGFTEFGHEHYQTVDNAFHLYLIGRLAEYMDKD